MPEGSPSRGKVQPSLQGSARLLKGGGRQQESSRRPGTGASSAGGEEGARALQPSGDCGAAVAQSELGIGIRAGRAAMVAALPDYPAS